MTRPTKLRVLPRSEWARQGIGEQWRGVLVQFDGDDGNDYRLFVRSARLHSHKPLVDLPHGATKYVPDPNGHIHPNKQFNDDGTVNRVRFVRTPPRRTWTQIGGYDQATGRSRTLANQPLHVVASEMPGEGPWQIMIDDRRDHTGETHSNMVEWDVTEAQPSRMDLIVAAVRTFTGRRTRDGRPYVRDLRKHADRIPNITTAERDEAYKLSKQ